MTARELREARIAEQIAIQKARIAEKINRVKEAKAAKKKADKATKAKLVEATAVATVAAVEAETEQLTISKADRAKLISAIMEEVQTISTDSTVFMTMGLPTATISMVEKYTGKTCIIKNKSYEVKKIMVGPLPVLACTSISARFLKGGLRCNTVEQNDAWFVEFESHSIQSTQEQRDRIATVIDELIAHGCFGGVADVLANVNTQFKAKLYVPADKPVKPRKVKSRDNGLEMLRVRF